MCGWHDLTVNGGISYPNLASFHGGIGFVGSDVLRRGSLLQNQEEHEAIEASGGVRKQGRKRCWDYPVRPRKPSELPFVGDSFSVWRADRAFSSPRHLGIGSFLYDGNRINDDDTPASLEMEDNG